MRQVGLGIIMFLIGGAVNIATGDPSATFVVLFISMFVIAYYAVNYPDAPTEYEER